MVSCFICKVEFINNNGGQLTNHIKKHHNINLVDYVILTEYNNIPPKCKCGLCDEVPHLYRGKFLNYAKGHDGFKFKENEYIKKYGIPKCKKCDKEVGFYRGSPNKYCKCRPRYKSINGEIFEWGRLIINKRYKKTNILYQSSYEYDFLKFCEENNVLHLVSRSPSFKYLNSKSHHFPDFLFNDEYVIEIKSKWILDLQGGMDIIQEKIKTIGSKYKYLLILDKDYYKFNKILKGV